MFVLMRLARRARDERGFTLVIVMFAMMAVLAISGGTYMAVSGDTRSSAYNQDEKTAYSAAESGLSWYQAQLTKDPGYWTLCANVPTVNGHAAPVWDGRASTMATQRAWADVNDPMAAYTATPPADKALYNVELLPASGSANNAYCDPANPDGTMIDGNGTFRIRVTGRAGSTRRAIVASFRRKGFLDYLYYTKFETLDSPLAANAIGIPAWPTRNSATPPSLTFDQWSAANCNQEFWTAPNGRLVSSSPSFALKTYTNGQYDPPGAAPFTNFNPPVPCTDVQFAAGDQVNGPMHTSDSILVCGNPSFGGSATDSIEIEAPAALAVRDAAAEKDPNNNSYWGCATPKNPTFVGKLVTDAQPISPPQSNSALASAVAPCCRFLGKTIITLNSNNTMTVKNNYMGFPGGKTINQPANGVIYAVTPSGAPCSGYNPLNTDADEDTCGDIAIQGSATQNLTVGADNDVIVTGNLQPDASAPNALIGLIAQQYVRVWHPVGSLNATWYGFSSDPATFDNAGKCTSPNALGSTLNTITVKAAILALSHSFMVDNWRCGPRMTNLNVTGAIAQLYRGPVGTNGATPTGYPKNYVYDTRLKYRSPPSFLNPVQSAWRTVRIQEQGGAANIAGR